MDGKDRETIFQKTKEIVMEVFDVDEVTPDSTLIDDLGAESIDFLDLSFKIEKEFGIHDGRHHTEVCFKRQA